MSRTARPRRTAVGWAFACCLFTAVLAARGAPRPSRPLSGSGIVVRVTDGDSLRVRFADGVERRVRLIGVNAAELDSRVESEALEAFLSRRFAFSHLERREVRLEYDATPVDVFGRVLAYVFTPKGELFNELIIRRGFARAFLKYPFRGDYRERFAGAEAEARRAARGLWRKGEPQPISASEARAHLGQLARVRFECVRIEEKRGFFFLLSAGDPFEALILRDRRRLFPRSEALIGRRLCAYGFLEEYGGKPQIILSFPSQLSRD